MKAGSHLPRFWMVDKLVKAHRAILRTVSVGMPCALLAGLRPVCLFEYHMKVMDINHSLRIFSYHKFCSLFSCSNAYAPWHTLNEFQRGNVIQHFLTFQERYYSHEDQACPIFPLAVTKTTDEEGKTVITETPSASTSSSPKNLTNACTTHMEHLNDKQV